MSSLFWKNKINPVNPACPVAPEDGTGASLMTPATAGGMGGENHLKAGALHSPESFTHPFCTENCARRTKKCASKPPCNLKSQRYQPVGFWYACCTINCVYFRNQEQGTRGQISEVRYQRATA
jgi:hypothetical protein